MIRRGLVLEGGGAKGAYQFGCLWALAEHRIEFAAISGTSVGALNGALVAYDRLKEGRDYWSHLSPRKVVTPRYRWLPFSSLLMLYLASYWANRDETLPPFTTRTLGITFLYFLFMVALIGFAPLLDRSMEAPPEWGFWPRVGFASAVYGLILILWIAQWLLRRARFSVVEPRPIRNLVSRIISGHEPRMPLYITLTRQSAAFDPDRPRMYYGKRNDTLVWGAVPDEYAFPEYLNLGKMPPGLREEALLASAALPLGIFPSVELGGVTYVDGGVADNLPLDPLIRTEQCEELVIIALRPWTEAALKSHWQEKERLTRLQQLSPDDARQLYFDELSRRGGDPLHAEPFNPPVNLPLAEPASWPARVVLICPDKPLGSFLTGTMRFSGRYARRLLQQGYLDATRVINGRGAANSQFPLPSP